MLFMVGELRAMISAFQGSASGEAITGLLTLATAERLRPTREPAKEAAPTTTKASMMMGNRARGREFVRRCVLRLDWPGPPARPDLGAHGPDRFRFAAMNIGATPTSGRG